MTNDKAPAPSGILHFAIGVSDLAQGREFYEDVLGCTYLRQNDTTVFMQAGPDYFVLTNTKHHTPPNPPGEYEFHHAFIVEGDIFDNTLKHVENCGYPIIVYEDEGHRTFTGRHAYIHDPFGNSIEIIDFHGIGDFGRPDYQGRGRRQKMAEDK
jgi:catechol 2,3-dioxygenase-like lactoylglutathione lyase family enzyme